MVLRVSRVEQSIMELFIGLIKLGRKAILGCRIGRGFYTIVQHADPKILDLEMDR